MQSIKAESVPLFKGQLKKLATPPFKKKKKEEKGQLSYLLEFEILVHVL